LNTEVAGRAATEQQAVDRFAADGRAAGPRTAPSQGAGRLHSLRMHRLMRQLHLWIGAWGAIAAILFGVTGFMQNHRALMKLPQGSSTEVSSVELAVPASARTSRDALRIWLRDEQHIEVENQRGGPPGPQGQGRGREQGPEHGQGREQAQGRESAQGREPAREQRWNFAGGNARVVKQVEYVQGADTVTVRTNIQSPLAVLERLHKGVGGGVAWILLGDSFALAMVMLGITGLVLWSRGRSTRQMVFSIVGVAVIVLLVIGGSAVM
jgi:hypothetical protein